MARGEAGISPAISAGRCCTSEVGKMSSVVSRNSPRVHHFMSWMTSRSGMVSKVKRTVPTAADAEARESWLHDYHAWLRALPPLLPEDLTGASVELRERVRLMEAAVLVQAEVLQARTSTRPLVGASLANVDLNALAAPAKAESRDAEAPPPPPAKRSPRWRTTGSAKADLLRSVGADPGAVDELAAAAARARARANYEIM